MRRNVNTQLRRNFTSRRRAAEFAIQIAGRIAINPKYANNNSPLTPTFAGAGQLRGGLSTIFAGLLHSSTGDACPGEASLGEGFFGPPVNPLRVLAFPGVSADSAAPFDSKTDSKNNWLYTYADTVQRIAQRIAQRLEDVWLLTRTISFD